MTEGKQPRARTRAASLAFVLAAAVLGAAAIYHYGPRPSGEGAVAEAPAPAPEPAEPAAAPGGPAAAAEGPGGAECCGGGGPTATAPQVKDFIGGLYPVTASGRVAGGRDAFLDGLEKAYRLRGYKSLSELLRAAVKERRRDPKLERFYWRYEPEGGAPALIGAVGPDADPHSGAPTPRPASFNTVVTDDGAGGLRWTTFRRDLTGDASAAHDLGSEAPGLDPPGVPRPPGLSRRFSFGGQGDGSLLTFYTSTEPPAELARWYAEKMPPDWQFAPDPSAAARTISEGAMVFTRGRQFCLIWVAGGEGGEPTSVIVSFKG